MAVKALTHLDGLLGTPTTEEDAGLPSPNATEYRPHSRPANKPIYALHLIGKGWDVRSFQYADLDSDSRYTPAAIRLCFTGLEPMRVVIHGRNLWRLYDGIHRQVIPWVMESARDFAKDGECLVTRIEVTAVRDEQRVKAQATDR